jgi:hypothetical protein
MAVRWRGEEWHFPSPLPGRGAGVRVFRLALQHDVLTTIPEMLEAILAVLEQA